MANFKNVTFYQGAPIDPADLNTLQSNITEVWTVSNNLLDATTNNGQTQSTLPVVHGDSAQVTLSGGKGKTQVDFTGKFASIPTIVASITKTLSEDNDQFSVSAKALSSNKAEITVNSSNKNYAKTITVNYIAVENRAINRV